MTGRTSYRGVINESNGKTSIFWGSVKEIAIHIELSYRAALLLLAKDVKISRLGWRIMTAQEMITHYQVIPKMQITRKGKKHQEKNTWLLTFLKDWKKGQPYSVATDRWSGSPQDFCRMSGCNQGIIYRHINTHKGLPEAFPCKSIRGWTIARIRENVA